MNDLKNNNVIEGENPIEFGDCEAAKLAALLHDHQHSINHSLQQTIGIEQLTSEKIMVQNGNYVCLGPCFKPKKIEEALDSLTECFPAKFSKPPFLNEPEKLDCHWVRSSNKPTNGWTCSIDTGPWFKRLSSRHDSWKRLRIYEFLRLSTYPRFPFYDALTAGLVCCWNPCLNVFITSPGFRTITLEDIAFLTGLSPTGIYLPVHSLIDGAIDMEKTSPWKNKSNMSFSSVVDYYTSSRNKSLSAEITRKEEVLFINFAFSKLMMFPSCNVNRTFLKLAANIEASGLDPKKAEPLCLGPLFLGQVYRCLYRLRTNKKTYTAGGPVWFLPMWGLFYFSYLARQKGNARLDYEELEAEFDKSTAVPVNECCCYGEVAVHSVSPVVHLSFEEVLRGLLVPYELSQSDWYPFSGKDGKVIPLYLHDSNGTLVEDTSGEWMKRAAPVWLLELSCTNFREGDGLHWLSVLQSRDIMCFEPKVIGVEVYNPNLVARQFGMTQGLGIPFYKTLNRPWGSRPNFVEVAPKSWDNRYDLAETWLKSVIDEVSSHRISPWFRWAAVDSGYELWWSDFLQRCQASWPEAIITLVQRVQSRANIDPNLSKIEASSSASTTRAKARTPIVCSLAMPLSQEISPQGSPVARGQKRKSEREMAACTASLSKKVDAEQAEVPDDNALLKTIRYRTIRPRRTVPVDSFINGSPEPVIASLLTSLEHSKLISKSCSLIIPGDANLQENPSPQSREADASNNQINNHKLYDGVNGKAGVTTQDSERGCSHIEADFPGSLVTIASEETVVETAAPEPEDSLEPPHEMVRGMGSFNINGSCLTPSGEPYLPGINPLQSSPHRAEDQLSFKEEMEDESGAHDPVTPDMSRALVNSFFVPESALRPLSLEVVSYPPDKALTEINSVVYLIEDTLRPFPITSAFDVEKEKAEEIVSKLQSNVKDLEAYANLADQIHRLLVESPLQFRPLLAHYQTSFLSLRDQLQNIRDLEDSTTCHVDGLSGLSTVAKSLRDLLQTSQGRIDQLRAECNLYDMEIDELESKLLDLKLLRESKQKELAAEEQKYKEFSSTWFETIPSLQEAAKNMVTAHQSKAQWECTLKTIKDNIHSFVGLLRTM